MILPSFRNYAFAKVVDYSALTNLGIPASARYVSNTNDNYFRRNCWSMFHFDNKLFLGSGNSNNTGVGADDGSATWLMAIDLTDDSYAQIPYANASQTDKQFDRFFVIDGELWVPGIDSKETADVTGYSYGSGVITRHTFTGARNHCYAIHKCRRDGYWVVGHGVTAYPQNCFTRVSDFADFPFNYDTAAPAALTSGPRGLAVLEFGPDESSRVLCLNSPSNYSPFFGSTTYLDPPTTTEVISAQTDARLFELRTSDYRYTALTKYAFNGLDPEFVMPTVWPSTNGTMLGLGNYFVNLNKYDRVDDDTYIGVISRSPSSYSRNELPGTYLYAPSINVSLYGYVSAEAHGGVYYLSLTTEKSVDVAAGNTFLQCTRALPNPQNTGRQWDYHVVGSDLYILTETIDHKWHIYKNGSRILTVTNVPCPARCFRVVGDSIYFGMGSAVNDLYWQNLTTINSNSGRVVKAANVLAGIP